MEWPADALPARAPLALCVVNDAAVADALERTIRGRAVEGHDLTVGRLKAGAPLPTCHVLYLAGSDLKSSLDVIATLKDVSVLTVSDAARFARAGGMVELFIENGRMRFAVNVDALQPRAGSIELASARARENRQRRRCVLDRWTVTVVVLARKNVGQLRLVQLPHQFLNLLGTHWRTLQRANLQQRTHQ